MPQNKDLKRLVRARMAETGERYTQALTHVLSQPRFEETSQEVPVTTTARPLPEEPQALDFGLTS